ncbi:MAG: diacylglycerol kinase [Xanthomonadales bacterium]|nr:diacylglycerol kinase [Xanthomonadales bacterium]
MLAFRYSLQGLKAALRHEASFRLEVQLAAILIPLGLYLGGTPTERVLMVGSVLLVLITELLNGSIEAVVDKTTPEFHELAGRAKDMGSAAVFVAMSNVVLTWGLLLLPRWLG